jgi:hypothetical protein
MTALIAGLAFVTLQAVAVVVTVVVPTALIAGLAFVALLSVAAMSALITGLAFVAVQPRRNAGRYLFFEFLDFQFDFFVHFDSPPLPVRDP